jgi:hypothetical protein
LLQDKLTCGVVEHQWRLLCSMLLTVRLEQRQRMAFHSATNVEQPVVLRCLWFFLMSLSLEGVKINNE